MLIEMSHETYHAYVVHIQIVPSFLGLASSHYYNGIAFLLCGSGSNGHVTHKFKTWPLGLTFASPKLLLSISKGHWDDLEMAPNIIWLWSNKQRRSNFSIICLSNLHNLRSKCSSRYQLNEQHFLGILLFHHFRKRGRLQERTGTPLRRREWRKPRSGWKAGEVPNWGNRDRFEDFCETSRVMEISWRFEASHKKCWDTPDWDALMKRSFVMMFCCQIDIPLGNGKFSKKAWFIGQCGDGCSYSFAKPGKWKVESSGLFLVWGHQSYVKKSMRKLSNSQLWSFWRFGGPKNELVLCFLWMTFTCLKTGIPTNPFRNLFSEEAPLRSSQVKHLVESSHAVQEKAQIVVGQPGKELWFLDSFHWSGSPSFLAIDANYGVAKIYYVDISQTSNL